MIEKLLRKESLSFEEAFELYNRMCDMGPVNISAHLIALQSKGYGPEELAGLAQAMRCSSPLIDIGPVVDTCGTGGDGSNTINVSTASSILLSCLAPVAKHGNGAVTSRSGSSTVMEALGINVPNTPEKICEGFRLTNFCFLHAPYYHTSLAPIMPVRKALGIATVFNVLGPLANPARPKYQMLGVSSCSLASTVAEALDILGITRGAVVNGYGIDEVHPFHPTTVFEVGAGMTDSYEVTPDDFGMKKTKINECTSSYESARRITAVFNGNGTVEDRSIIVINTAMALHVYTRRDLDECADIVNSLIGDMAVNKLEEIRNVYTSSNTQ